MSSARATSVEYTAFIHATEDHDKVLTAVLNVMPPRLRGRADISVEETHGHYENPITILRACFRNPDQASESLTWVLSNMPPEDRTFLAGRLDLHLDEKSRVYIRLDKQEAFLGRIKLSYGNDVIRVRFTFKGAKNEVKELLLLMLG